MRIKLFFFFSVYLNLMIQSQNMLAKRDFICLQMFPLKKERFHEHRGTATGAEYFSSIKMHLKRAQPAGRPVCRCQIEIYYLMCRVCVNTWPRPKSKCIKFKSTYVQVNGSPLVRSLSIELKKKKTSYTVLGDIMWRWFKSGVWVWE